MKRLVRDDGGSTVTELAFILPVLLLILFGMMDGGRVLSAWVVLTNETREAARYGAAGLQDQALYNGGSTSSWLSAVQSYATTRMDQTLSGADLTVTPTFVPPTASIAGNLTVTAQYRVTMVTPLMNSVLGTVTVSAQSTARTE